MFYPGPSRRLGIAGILLAAVLGGPGVLAVAARERPSAVAVFPVENLSVGAIPGAEVRDGLVNGLTAAGVRVLDHDRVEAFMASHRVRYGAGIDTATAQQLRQEAGADGVLFISVEFSSEAEPAKVALFARLVSIADAPVVVWADDVGLSGDDAPGLFELGLVNGHPAVLRQAVERLAGSLTTYLQTGTVRAKVGHEKAFRPKSYHRSVTFEAGRAHPVAVVPFANLSARRNAGEIMALHFTRHLVRFPEFRVVDTGVTRQQLLNARVIMDGGLSISDAEMVAALIEAEFVLAGRVLRYEDFEGPAGRAGVEFSTVLIERATRRVVWSSNSYNEGRDSAGLFERGASKTAHAMAAQMAALTTELIAGRRP
jgi:TolB-like protein